MNDKIIHTVTARSTGVSIAIIELGEAIEEDKWAAQCIEHGWVVYTPTRRDAHAEGRVPEEWCGDCKREGDGVVFTPEFATAE